MGKCLPRGLRALNNEERVREDVAMETEVRCIIPQVKDCRHLWKLEKVRDRVSCGASSKNLALRTPGFEPRKTHGGLLPSEVAVKLVTTCYMQLQ